MVDPGATEPTGGRHESVEVIKVIKTTLTKRGSGVAPDDPVREITQYWDMDGNLLWEEDPIETFEPHDCSANDRPQMSEDEPTNDFK